MKTYAHALVMEAEEAYEGVAVLQNNSYLDLSLDAPSLVEGSEKVAVITGSIKVAP